MRKVIDCEIIEQAQCRPAGILIRAHDIPSSANPGDIIEWVSDGDTVAKVCVVSQIPIHAGSYHCEGCWGYTHTTASTHCQTLCGYRCHLEEIPDIMEEV